MRVDYHIHTHMCGHASGTMEELVESAITKGIEEIGIADHLPLTYSDDRGLSMGPEELPLYVERVLELQKTFGGRITIRLGIEADYHPPAMEEVERMLGAYPFDYVIGSIHFLRDWIFDDPRHKDRYADLDLDEFYLEFFEAQKKMVSTGLFDIVSHPDLVKKFDMRASSDLEVPFRELLESIKAAGACYEINTAGLRWPAREMYPEPSFVRMGRALGVPATVGSDAHSPGDVGRDIDDAISLLVEAGYESIATFERREMRLVPIAGAGPD